MSYYRIYRGKKPDQMLFDLYCYVPGIKIFKNIIFYYFI